MSRYCFKPKRLRDKKKPFYPNNAGHWPTSEEGLGSSHPLDEKLSTHTNSLRPKYDGVITSVKLIRDGVYID